LRFKVVVIFITQIFQAFNHIWAIQKCLRSRIPCRWNCRSTRRQQLRQFISGVRGKSLRLFYRDIRITVILKVILFQRYVFVFNQ